VDGIPTGEEVLAGTFFLNERPIIILFDSGASHDFMSSTCAKKAGLTLVASGAPYVISTPGGRVDVDHIAQKVPLKLSGKVLTGRINYTIVDGIPTAKEVLAGMFFLNEHPIIILFDSGVSHDFMSFTCAKKAGLTLVVSGAPYVISTPGGRVDVDHIAQKVPVKLFGKVFSTNLIILCG
jgi:predicted aspartyl protease